MKKIRFEIQEMSGLGDNFPTQCPYSIEGRYTREIISVGSRACRLCEYHGGIAADYVKCNYERYVSILQKQKEEKQWLKQRWAK